MDVRTLTPGALNALRAWRKAAEHFHALNTSSLLWDALNKTVESWNLLAQDKLASLPNVTVIKQAQTTEVIGDGQKVTGIRYKDRVSGSEQVVELEGIFVQIGLLPNTDWLKGTVELSKHGEIIIDARGQTSVPGVFAAGDCTTVPYKQIIIAMGAGATAALSAFDHLIRA